MKSIHVVIASVCFDEFIISDRLIKNPRKRKPFLYPMRCVLLLLGLNRWYFMLCKHDTQSLTHTNTDLRSSSPNQIECEQSIKTLWTWFLAFFCRKPPHIIASWSGTKYCEALAINMSSRRRRETKLCLVTGRISLKITFLIDYVKTHYTNTHKKKYDWWSVAKLCCCEHSFFPGRWNGIQIGAVKFHI